MISLDCLNSNILTISGVIYRCTCVCAFVSECIHICVSTHRQNLQGTMAPQFSIEISFLPYKSILLSLYTPQPSYTTVSMACVYGVYSWLFVCTWCHTLQEKVFDLFKELFTAATSLPAPQGIFPLTKVTNIVTVTEIT